MKIYLKVTGMNILENKQGNHPSIDPINLLIFEKGLRIRTIFIEKELDLLLIILNNGNLIKSRISFFKKLANANQEELLKWELRNEGAGISWGSLDEDLSLYGFIKDVSNNSKIDHLLDKTTFAVIA